MATMVLQTLGSAIGSAVAGPVGALVGRLAGGFGGALVDRALAPHASPRYAIGPQLKSMDGIASTEGAGLPRVYGRARIGGQMIWATRFLEETNVSMRGGGGGKGGGGSGSGATQIEVTFSYFANFAIGLCEGPIAFVRRIFADGVELDMTTLPMRIYHGTEDQLPDPLIAAKEDPENVPAYRGLAYVVFEQLPLQHFGNRIPQFTFEVVRPVGGLGTMIRAVDIIPGATEEGYQASLHLDFSWPGVSTAENRNQLTATTDWIASIDALQALCPNLESVALVVAWFGDDLRAGQCRIEPKVDSRFKTIGEFNFITGEAWPPDWSVAGATRATASLVTQIDGRSAFGGTPSDDSVRAAIADLKARGLKVTFYPFVMMDIPPGNVLADPHTATAPQPPFPWRGRVTCDPAPGAPGSVDATTAASVQIDTFFSNYRPFILHCAQLCVDAGGVDAFLVGSELVGLTRVRSAPGVYPAVSQLVALFGEVKAILPSAKTSYSADWTEYGAHVPVTGEVRFPLDPLWAAADFIGIDVYWPLTDWRDGDGHLDAAEADAIYDLDFLRRRIVSGEGYDWYYADADARAAQQRTPITDGLGEAWIYRQKDLQSFWSSAHYERSGGVRASQPTAWAPYSKPIWIMETGCPAVDRGANAPNVFPDPRSVDGGLPYFSRDGRDDLMQARFLEAMITHYDPPTPAANPVSPVYGGPMVDPARIHVWCWDARPFPAFPTLSSVWSDGSHWETGHWVTGRLEGAPLDRLVTELAGGAAPGLSLPRPQIYGFVDGYVIDRPMSPRDAVEPLTALYGFDAIVSSGAVRFTTRRNRAAPTLGDDDLVPDRDGRLVTFTRTQESELPHEIALSFTDSMLDYSVGQVLSRRLEGWSLRRSEAQTAVVTNRAAATAATNAWLADLWAGRDGAEFSLRPGVALLEPGDLVRLDGAGGGRLFQITGLVDGLVRKATARSADRLACDVAAPRLSTTPVAGPRFAGPPHVVFLDLAAARDDPAPLSFVAAFADPWPGSLAIWRQSGFGYEIFGRILRPATIGQTLDVLPAGPTGRFDRASSVTVRFGAAALSSVADGAALSGRTSMAIRGADGLWEIFAFARADLVGDNVWRLSRLLRGLGGESRLAARDAPAGSIVVLLDDALVPLARNTSEIGAPTIWRIGPADRDYSDPLYVQATIAATGKALTPFSPVRARATRGDAGVTISFIRCGRVDSDAWEGNEIPLGEATERYEIELALPGGGRRVLEMTSPSALYTAALEIADFGAPQSALSLSIFQLSAVIGRGFPLSATLPVA